MSVSNALDTQGLIPSAFITAGLGAPGDVLTITGATTPGSYITATTAGGGVCTLGPKMNQQNTFTECYAPSASATATISTPVQLLTTTVSFPNNTNFSYGSSSIALKPNGVAGKYKFYYRAVVIGLSASNNQLSIYLKKNGIEVTGSGRSQGNAFQNEIWNINGEMIVSLAPNDIITLWLSASSGSGASNNTIINSAVTTTQYAAQLGCLLVDF